MMKIVFESGKEKRKMGKRKMEKLGVETSLLGFGCMRFPTTAGGGIDEPLAEAMLDKAIAAGVNYIDTAYPYHNGESESFVGRVLSKYDRDSFYLATKLPLWAVNSLEDVDRIFQEQLKKLRTDHIDFYLMHAVSGDRWDKMTELGVVKRLEELKAQGKIRYLGFSFHDSYEVFEKVLNYRDWDFCQIQFNYMDAQTQAGTRGYELTVKKQVPLVIMEPVKGGTLAAFDDEITARLKAHDKEASIASFAMRWVGSFPNVKVILSGMSNMEQVEDNLKTFGAFKPLGEEEAATIDGIVKTMNDRVQNGCTGCRYCMPCPFGVNIPDTFRLWNTYHKYQNYRMVRRGWEGMEEASKPVNCKKCGKCEAACPQKLNIRQDLARAQEDLDKKEMFF